MWKWCIIAAARDYYGVRLDPLRPVIFQNIYYGLYEKWNHFFLEVVKMCKANGREIVFEVVEEQNSSLQLVRISNNTIFSKSKNRTKGGPPVFSNMQIPQSRMITNL